MPPINNWSENPVNVHITVVGINGTQKRSIDFPSEKLNELILKNLFRFAEKNRKLLGDSESFFFCSVEKKKLKDGGNGCLKIFNMV
jgi:hypothetical protein